MRDSAHSHNTFPYISTYSPSPSLFPILIPPIPIPLPLSIPTNPIPIPPNPSKPP